MFLNVLKSLFPPGAFWEIRAGSAFHRLLLALSDSLDRVHVSALGVWDVISPDANPQRYMKLLGVSSQEAITLLLDREAHFPASLSQSYVTARLQSLGYSQFHIHDQSNDNPGIIPTTKPPRLGMIDIHTQITKTRELRAGFSVGDSLREWRDSTFEKKVSELLPAHTQPQFHYQEVFNVTH